MGRPNAIQDKSRAFAIRVIKCYQYLADEKHETGTCPGGSPVVPKKVIEDVMNLAN